MPIRWRDTIIPLILGVAVVAVTLPPVSRAGDPLLFPKDNFSLKSRTIATAAGDKRVTYRSYLHVPYVASPVDGAYQSLNVYAPVQVDGVDVDMLRAPILFAIGVGGYMSCNNARQDIDGPAQDAPGLPPGKQPPANLNRPVTNVELALAAGIVVVTPGCRGRDNRAADGTYYGKAPAAIVDLKAAVRYLRHNRGVVPGNVDWIISTGVSAGGALAALLGASGNSELYEPYLKEIGAAEAEDHIAGSACFCPITDLEHADGAYEWMYGTAPLPSGPVDQELSRQLKASYSAYQSSLNLQGKGRFGRITAENYDRYLLQEDLIPSANKFLKALSSDARQQYLAKNRWITWGDRGASFTFRDYVTHVGRMKGIPAFDDLEMRQPEPILFGTKTIDARHFTEFSLRHAAGSVAGVDPEVQKLVTMMNAMYFIGRHHKGCAKYWWLRQGSLDNHTSQTVMANLGVSLENQGKAVNSWLYWDAGHGANEDGEQFIAWIGEIAGHATHVRSKK
jgi:hypothetical protein